MVVVCHLRVRATAKPVAIRCAQTQAIIMITVESVIIDVKTTKSVNMDTVLSTVMRATVMGLVVAKFVEIRAVIPTTAAAVAIGVDTVKPVVMEAV